MFLPYTYNTHILEDEAWVLIILISSSDCSFQQIFSFTMTICKRPGFRGGRIWERFGGISYINFHHLRDKETEAQRSTEVVNRAQERHEYKFSRSLPDFYDKSVCYTGADIPVFCQKMNLLYTATFYKEEMVTYLGAPGSATNF